MDFKVLECVEPALRHLQSVGAAKQLGGHLWLNADVFAGPGYPERFLSPINARRTGSVAFATRSDNRNKQQKKTAHHPGAMNSKKDLALSSIPRDFVQLCAELVPEAVLSLKLGNPVATYGDHGPKGGRTQPKSLTEMTCVLICFKVFLNVLFSPFDGSESPPTCFRQSFF